MHQRQPKGRTILDEPQPKKPIIVIRAANQSKSKREGEWTLKAFAWGQTSQRSRVSLTYVQLNKKCAFTVFILKMESQQSRRNRYHKIEKWEMDWWSESKIPKFFRTLTALGLGTAQHQATGLRASSSCTHLRCSGSHG